MRKPALVGFRAVAFTMKLHKSRNAAAFQIEDALGLPHHADHLVSVRVKSVGAFEVTFCLSKYRSQSSFTPAA
ncbi:hypothetical protein CO667_17480 [Rhizobium sp. L43]|nr:hypothetical protein CO667_17480 [Rhizobium sp. L43]